MYKNIVFAYIIFGFSFLANAQIDTTGAKEESNIFEKIYDAPLSVLGEKQMNFEELYNRKPLLLALIFTRCSGVCSPFLLQLKESLQFKNDNSLNVLVLSFDPRDSLEDMNLLAQRFELENDDQWVFAITDSISKLNESISFYPVWDSLTNQYDHDALLVGINNDGFITKKLIGIRQGHDMDLLIASVNNIYSPSYRLPTKSSLFSCFNYDPKTGKNKPGLGLLFIVLPVFVTVLLLVSISFFAGGKAPENKVLS